jgi:hypothetical protein
MLYVEGRMHARHVALTLTFAALALATACKPGSSASKLEGRWRGIKAVGVPADHLGEANLFASTMELDFHGDQVSVHTGSEKQSSRFHVVKDEKTAVTIATDQDGPDDAQTFTFVDDKTITWTITPGKSIQFQKE